MEAGDRLAGVRQVLGEQREEPSVLGHGQRARLRHVHARLLRRGRRAARQRHQPRLGTQPRLHNQYNLAHETDRAGPIRYLFKETVTDVYLTELNKDQIGPMT